MKNESLPVMNVGLIGHVDHGKTTLTSALSGKWTDTHSEELKRGITIKLGYADIEIRKDTKNNFTNKVEVDGKKTELIRKISLVDAPGHETLMAVMISGAAIMDGAILMIAANEVCPQPQTREHLTVLKILGIKNIIVVQNKVDLITQKEAKKHYEQINKFVTDTLGFEVPIIPMSAQKGANLDILIEAIEEFMPTPKRKKKAESSFIVARSFDINKPGTKIEKLTGGVLGGTITGGTFKVGQEIEISPGFKTENKGIATWTPIKTKIKNIVAGKKSISEKGPGGSVAIETELDPSQTKTDSLVGNVIGNPGKTPEIIYNLKIETHLFDKVLGAKEDLQIEEIKVNEPLVINIGTATTWGLVNQIGNTTVIKLKRAISANLGAKIAISRKFGSRWHLIGWGTIK
jgi:translation initiation factor 2 subunit 3